jgi:hypothetical protein
MMVRYCVKGIFACSRPIDHNSYGYDNEIRVYRPTPHIYLRRVDFLLSLLILQGHCNLVCHVV